MPEPVWNLRQFLRLKTAVVLAAVVPRTEFQGVMSKVRILVVDDEEDICDIVQLLLENAESEVVGVDNGHKALSLLEKQSFDLVITDMLMPEMDGVELINALRRVNPEQRILAMSAGGHAPRESYLQIAAMYGVNGVLAKPFNRDQLIQGVKACGLELPAA